MSSQTPLSPSERRPWRIVMAREIMVKLTDKAFIMSTLLTLLLLIGGSAASALLSARTTTSHLAVVDTQGEQIAQTTSQVTRAADSNHHIEVKKAADLRAGEQLLRNGNADALLVKNASGAWELVTKRGTEPDIQRTVQQVLQGQAMAETAAKAGTTVDKVMAGSVVGNRALEGDQDGSRSTAGMILGMVFAVLFMMSAMTYGMQIANSVIEEKQSRIVEILVAAIPVRHLLAGKVLGNTVLALGQMVLLATVGLIGARFTPLKDMFGSVSGSVAWFLVFFVAGFLALACVWAAAGAMCTRTEDLQQTSQPLIWILMIAYMAAFMAKGTVRIVLSYVPIVSSILMPVRIVDGTARWWDLIIALVLNLAFAALTVRLGERIYRRALLQTQGRLSYRQAIKLQS